MSRTHLGIYMYIHTDIYMYMYIYVHIYVITIKQKGCHELGREEGHVREFAWRKENEKYCNYIISTM